MDQGSVFFDEWLRSLREQYKHVTRNDDRVTLPSLTAVMQRVGFGEDELRLLRLEATMRADELPEDFTPDLDIISPQGAAAGIAHPAECLCPQCLAMDDGAHDDEGQPITSQPAENEAQSPVFPAADISARESEDEADSLTFEDSLALEAAAEIEQEVEETSDEPDEEGRRRDRSPGRARPRRAPTAEPVLTMAITDADRRWMRLALAEAERALATQDVPVGALAVYQGKIIGRGHNRREADKDPTAHAEIIAIREAAKSLGSWRLDGVTLYCTLEPCAMCAGAMVLSRLPRLVYAATDPKAGAAGSVAEITRHHRLNHHVHVERGLYAEEAGQLLRDFFRQLRRGSQD